MVSRTTSLLDSLHTTKAVASYSTATEICASALSRNFAVEGGHNASKRDELAPLRSIVSSRQRAVNRFANSRVVNVSTKDPAKQGHLLAGSVQHPLGSSHGGPTASMGSGNAHQRPRQRPDGAV